MCILWRDTLTIEQGRIFRDLRLPGVSAAERTALYVAAVEALAKLHSLDLASLNLEGYGKGSGYCKRQVRLDTVLCKSKITSYISGKMSCDIQKWLSISKGVHLDEAVRRSSTQRHSSHEWTVRLVDEEFASQWQRGHACPWRFPIGQLDIPSNWGRSNFSNSYLLHVAVMLYKVCFGVTRRVW